MSPIEQYLFIQWMEEQKSEKKTDVEDEIKEEKEVQEMVTKPKSKKIDIKVIEERTRIFEEAKTKVKNDYFGIDREIDEIFEAIRLWYLYPEYLTRPVIVNLYGTPGIGKTSVVKSIVQYLKIEQFLNIPMDSQGESASSVIGNMRYDGGSVCTILNMIINRGISPSDKSVLLLDEMHRFRTKNERGESMPKKRFTDIWTLLSDGSLYDENLAIDLIDDAIASLENRYDNIRSNLSNNAKTFDEKVGYLLGINMINEKEREAEEKLKNDMLKEKGYIPWNLKQTMKSEMDDFMNGDNNNAPIASILATTAIDVDDMKKIRELELLYMGPHKLVLNELFNTQTDSNNDDSILSHYMKRLSNKVILEFLKYKKKKILNDRKNLTSTELRMKDLDYVYSQMLIFICGNTNMDMYDNNKINEAKFHEYMKELFMPEQVSRFGNNYVFYGILNKEDYENVIEREIHLMEDKINKDYDLHGKKEIRFNVEEIKKEVFENLPKNYEINGVRPVYSEVQRVLSTKIPEMIISVIESLDDDDSESCYIDVYKRGTI